MSPADPARLREDLRKRVWDLMESRNITKFPRPVYGRIPNFVGADAAALRLSNIGMLNNKRVVKVNPDSPQKPVRELVLRSGKTLVMPTPRISEGFLLLDPDKIPDESVGYASTISGAFKHGERVDPWSLPKIDLIVAGSVAVDFFGGRLGKGEGYSELEYGILFECGKVTSDVYIVTTVHDSQVVSERIPLEPWDFTVDMIVTPARFIWTRGPRVRPEGLLWEFIKPEKFNEIPLLKILKTRGC